MTKPISNTALTAGEFDDEPDEFVLPKKTSVAAPQEAPQDDLPISVTKPQDALDRSTQVPPQLVEEVMDNVELLRPVARSMAAINLHNLFLKVQHPATNAKDRLEFQQVLNKMGGLTEIKDTSKGDNGPGFSINIVLPANSQPGAGITIEGKAE